MFMWTKTKMFDIYRCHFFQNYGGAERSSIAPP